MKKRLLSVLMALCMVLSLAPTMAFAAAKDITVSEATYYDSGALKTVSTSFSWTTAAADSRLVLMTEELSKGELTNLGSYYNQFQDFDSVLDYDKTNHDFGIITSSNEEKLSGNMNLTFNFKETDIPLNVDETYYVYLWTCWAQSGTPYYYPDYLFYVINVKDGEVKYSEDGDTFKEVVSENKYAVAVTAGDNMTKTSGDETQEDLTSAMTPVVYTANEGYYFPEDYTVDTVNGIMVKRDSVSQITVYGTPSANATITLTAPTKETSVVNAQAPNITTELIAAEYTKGTAAVPLTVVAESPDGGTLSYKWLKGNGITASIIDGATSSTYTPPTDTVGTVEYTCVVTNTIYDNGDGGEKTAEAYSSAWITVTEGSTPTPDSTPSTGSSSKPKYSAKLAEDADMENGDISFSQTRVRANRTVTITVTPDAGYELDKLVILDQDGDKVDFKDNGDGTFTFTMPRGGVEVEPFFQKIEANEPAPDQKEQEEMTMVLYIGQLAYLLNDEPQMNDVAPTIRGERTMLPIRVVAENLGAEVTWNEADQTVTIVKDDLEIVIYINQSFALVNGDPVELDSPAFIANDRTYLPLRFVAENLGAEVIWDADSNAVTIILN